jgi:hypothetical protein
MRNARIAEWLLSLVMTPERAMATVGDLIEATPARHVLSFWASVISTLLSFVWRDLAADPWQLGRLAVRALVLGLVMMFLSVFLFSIVAGTLMVLSGGHTWSALGGSAASSVARCLGILLVAALQFEIGRWLARRAPGREIAACLAFTVLLSAVGFAGNLVWPTGAREQVLELTVYQIPYALPLLVGAALIRRARLTPAST